MASFVRAAVLASELPPVGNGWMKRAEGIATTVAASLKSKAGLPEEEWQRLPCLVGSSSHFIGAREADPGVKLGPPVEFAARLARCFGVSGPVIAVNTACTSGLTALALARDMIDAGVWRHALVLGVELANRLTAAGFGALGLLSATQARPCDRKRDGLSLGEGFGAALVSDAGPWRIAAAAAEIDPSGFTAPAPNEQVIARVMRDALSAAGWQPRDVDLLKLQAGGSPSGDLAEARAVRSLFASPPLMVSFKGAIGHTLGASGPAELALLLDAIDQGHVPSTTGFATPDPELGLEPKAADGRAVRRVLFNLAGFGGHVACLALARE
jgi:3-oxoacyl-[acyl-carrier-protein] synthase-1